ncbi:synaptotagmin-8 isoform X3 [Eptesicus fuscus]|uniref:synaptotagmin-8 isoform X3 n=1 Tax=Eptesicus fuscus TaxID=29078 RepID=UPI0024040BB3|nr:synaptotagmin-8 isoform X3 [Eptesicus fuscus]
MRGVCREARGGPACLVRAGGRGGGQEARPVAANWHFGQSPGPPSPRLHSEPSPGHPGLLPCPGTPRLAAAGRWGGGQGPEGPSPQVTLPPWPSPPSQQGGEMGHPAGPHSAPAPMGTTAGSGLIPDLVARIPWPRWALVAIAVAAAILTASCLLCVVCCYCRRARRRKPRDKEAVGLGSVRGTTTTHLIRVGLKQAVDLRARSPGGTADPYARVSLSTQAGHRHETKVHRGTLCPVFDETCCFRVPLAELPRTTLWVQVLDFKRVSGHEPLGELHLPLGTVDLQHVLEIWRQLGPPGAAEAEQTGELCFSLQYVPGSGRLTVVVLEARGLSLGLAEPYVKVQLVLNRKKWKTRRTSARKGTAAPYFNEAFSFLVPLSQIQSVDLVLAIWARGSRLRAEPVGKVALGARASGQPLQHWADMLAHARRPIAQWHRLRPAGEVDRALGLQPHRRLPLPGS